jgi:hypothetical protein
MKAKIASLTLLTVTIASLSGCYVVPLNGVPPDYRGAAVVPVAPPVALTFTARLYPANEQAAGTGVIAGVITNHLNGRAEFSLNVAGEQFVGEATRLAGNNRSGVASAAGNRGGYVNCSYTMNNPTLGTGQCEFANGARYTLHVGG